MWWAETQALYAFLCGPSLLAAPVAGPQFTPLYNVKEQSAPKGFSGALSAFLGKCTIRPLGPEPSPWATFPVLKSEEET